MSTGFLGILASKTGRRQGEGREKAGDGSGRQDDTPDPAYSWDRNSLVGRASTGLSTASKQPRP